MNNHHEELRGPADRERLHPTPMKPALSWAVGLALACVTGPWAGAQTAAGLDIRVYAGLTITGAVGTVYSVECVADLAQTNTPGAWRCLEFVQLPASPYLWGDKSAPATGRRFYRARAFGAPTNMVFIPPGTFRMGSPTNEVGRDTDEGPQTDVIVSRGFWMGKCPVTQQEYATVTGLNPSWFDGVRVGALAPDLPVTTNDYGHDLARPVECVSWHDATNYLGILTQQERTAGRIPANAVYRLPTEAEWEYACRGWTSTRFSFGDDPAYTDLRNHGWYSDNSDLRTHSVGQKLPNRWGLYDMHGNVFEWCQDWWGSRYSGGTAIDPGGAASGSGRVMRGGDWYRKASVCRSAERGAAPPEINAFANLGFRAVLAPGQP